MQQEMIMYMQYYQVYVFERDKGNRGKAKREQGREKEVEKKEIRTTEKSEREKESLFGQRNGVRHTQQEAFKGHQDLLEKLKFNRLVILRLIWRTYH